MKRRPLHIALLLLLCGMSSGAQQPASEPVDGFVWPIAGKAGKVVLGFGRVPNPRSGNLYFNDGYFIAAPAGSDVVRHARWRHRHADSLHMGGAGQTGQPHL